MYWDELCYFLALARHKSLNRAAGQLQINHTTVARRVRSLEERLGTRLFEKTPKGYFLTAAGKEVFETAEGIEADIAKIERSVHGRDEHISGALRFTTIDFLAHRYMPALVGFHRAHPKVELDVQIKSTYSDLASRRADVALRFTNAPPDYAFGRRLARFRYAVYGARELVSQYPKGAPLSDYPWVDWSPEVPAMATQRWMRNVKADQSVVVRTQSPLLMDTLIAEGVGVGLMLMAFGDDKEDLLCLSEPIEDLFYDLWLVTHEDLKGTARVRVFLDYMSAAIQEAEGL